ncbi:hypothetical protein MTO96_044768 [Rhipicephalus appendiculatus]
MFKYLAEVPKAFQPFRITYTSEGNSDIYGAETDPVASPPNFAARPFIWTDTSKFFDVSKDDIVQVRDHLLWLSRLVHCYDAYELKDFRDGNPVPGAPPPGWAPHRPHTRRRFVGREDEKILHPKHAIPVLRHGVEQLDGQANTQGADSAAAYVKPRHLVRGGARAVRHCSKRHRLQCCCPADDTQAIQDQCR